MLNLMGSVRDGDGVDDLAKVELWLRRPNFTWVNLSDIETFGNNGEFSYQLNLENYGVGNYLIFGRAQDQQGLYSSWANQTFRVENQAFFTESIEHSSQLSLTGKTESNEIDILTGTPQSDLFELGDVQQVYYSNLGIEDYALINNFNINEDRIQLHGDLEDYSLGTASEDLPKGTTISNNNDELIAIVAGVSQSSFSENNFTVI